MGIDDNSEAPASQRPAETAAEPQLGNLIQVARNGAIWNAGSAEYVQQQRNEEVEVGDLQQQDGDDRAEPEQD